MMHFSHKMQQLPGNAVAPTSLLGSTEMDDISRQLMMINLHASKLLREEKYFLVVKFDGSKSVSMPFFYNQNWFFFLLRARQVASPT